MKRRRKLQPVEINPLVVDLSHHNDVNDFGKVKAAGYVVSIRAQVEFFLKIAAPDNTTLLALDHEDERVILIDAKEFLLRVEDAVGRKPVLYSGSLIKQQLGSRIDGYLAAHRLWLAQYGPRPVTPRNWPSAWLWQFTGDGVGPRPHSVPGIVDARIDINHFDGDAVKLAAEWSGPTTVEPATA